MPGDGYRLIAHSVDHRGPAVAWELCEDERPGQFDVDEARRLGVPEGPAFGELQRGGSVTAPDGSVVTPAAVLGPARRGRTLVFSGDTRPCASVRRAALGADLLVHEASFASEDPERARETRHSTAAEAAELAAASEVKLLALTHLGARATPRMIKDEARAVFAAHRRAARLRYHRAPAAGARSAGAAARGRASGRGEGSMTHGLVTIAVAGDGAEADSILRTLAGAGITARLEGAEGEIGGPPHDGPCRVLVESELVGAAQAALLDEDEADDLDY